jgi:tripartite-type tricarboxylate transporter receptor subunit TctC
VFTMKNFTRVSVAVFALCALALAAPAQAQGWPTRTVRFIVPLGPGSGVDIGARLFADRLSKKWGQSVVVENQPGGDAIVAINAFLSANDNHVLLMAPASAFTHHPYTMAKLPYNPNDLIPVARISNTIVAYSVPVSLGINTLPELLAKAKAEPDKLNWAGATGMIDFVLLAHLKTAGGSFTRVPYRNPVQPATDLAEGRIQFYIGAYAIVRPHVEAGKVKIIAITNRARAPIIPNVPTTTEAGYPQLATDGLIGLFATKELSADIRNKIAADVKEASADPIIGDRLNLTGQVMNIGNPAEFAASIDEQKAQAAAVAKILGLNAAQ